MTATLDKAFGYQGEAMNLQVGDVVFAVVSRGDKSAVLSRDRIRIGLAENGGDPAQDGCAFHVTGLDSLLAEFRANGLAKELSGIDVEQRDTGAWRVFYVVAPDGLCNWFGEREV